jgi:hypothetical protein
LCKGRKEGKRVKHVDIIHHFARDNVASGELSVVYCKYEDNVSDCLTKALAKPLFEKVLAGLAMCVACVTRSKAAPLTTRLYNPRISGSIVQQ